MLIFLVLPTNVGTHFRLECISLKRCELGWTSTDAWEPTLWKGHPWLQTGLGVRITAL